MAEAMQYHAKEYKYVEGEISDGFIDWVKKYEDIYYQHDPQHLFTCPVTIHVLLHIADGIIAAGPVWAYWAFPMERYCGWLQPSISSRYFPYASLNWFVLDNSRLRHIKLIYDIEEKLQLGPPKVDQGKSYVDYSTCTTHYPYHQSISLTPELKQKILNHLTLRFSVSPMVAKAALPEDFEEWGKIRIFNDGDLIRTARLQSQREDTQDASFVRYELLVDKNARYYRRAVILEPTTFFGQLQCVMAIHLWCTPGEINSPSCMLLVALIRTCKVIS
ncbi:hypothetical protein ABKN59_011880 [Abortiporus biennis]